MSFLTMYLLAVGGFAFHFLKMWYQAEQRNEQFIAKRTILWAALNLLASALLIYIGPTLPPDLLVMSPLTCVLIGIFGSSMLTGFVNTRRPKAVDLATFESEQDGIKTKVHFEKTTQLTSEGDDTGGSNPPPDKPKPPTPPGSQP